MGIGPIELQGAISRTTDFATIRHNEENKAVVDQANVVTNAQKQEEEKSTTVTRSDETSNYQRKFDAKEKGDNEYEGDGGSKKRSKGDNKDGKVVVKGLESSFDIRI